jgi:hypothetical protein
VAWDQHLTTELEGPSFISRTVVLRRVDGPALLVTQYPILHYTRFIVTLKQSDPNRRIGTFGLAAGGRLCPSPRRFLRSMQEPGRASRRPRTGCRLACPLAPSRPPKREALTPLRRCCLDVLVVFCAD